MGEEGEEKDTDLRSRGVKELDGDGDDNGMGAVESDAGRAPAEGKSWNEHIINNKALKRSV